MANEVLKKSRAEIIAQSSSALTADQYPGDGVYTLTTNCTTINNTYSVGGTENGKGADHVALVLDITTDPATGTATADIYYRTSEDDIVWTLWKYSHTVGTAIQSDGTTQDRIDAGIFVLTAQYTELAVASNDADFTSVLYAYPKLYEIQ